MTPERRDKINRVLAQRQPDLTVITEKVVKAHNLAAILRTCDAIGIPTLHCALPLDGYRTYSGTSASANKWVETRHYDSAFEPVSRLKEKGFQVVAAHLNDTAIDYREVDYTQPTAVLMGTERTGVSEEISHACDINVVVPMMGMVESLNVSVACAVILAEAQSQRQRAGFYQTLRIDEDERQRLFFKWAYPSLAKYCEERNLDYLPMDENGDLIPGTSPVLTGVEDKKMPDVSGETSG